VIVAKRLPKRPPLLRREPLRPLSIRIGVNCLEPSRRIPDTAARHTGVRLGRRHLTVAAGISKPVTLNQQVMTDFFSTLLTHCLAVLMLLWMLTRGSAARVSSLLYLVPPMTAIQALILFGEELNPQAIIGIAMTALGVFLVQKR
jgi:multidrug transporter EmrE-like cation transporter